MEQRAHGFEAWEEPLVTLRLPKLFDLRGDPYERADHEAAPYAMWRFDRAYLVLSAVAYVSQHLAPIWRQVHHDFAGLIEHM